jgi:hypothetical protein
MLMHVEKISSKTTKTDFNSHYVLNEKPIIIENGCKDWMAFKTWNVDYFIELGKNIDVRVSRYKKHGHEKPESRSSYDLSELMLLYKKYEQISTDDLLRDIYLAGWHYMDDLPNLMKDIKIPEMFADNILPKVNDSVFKYDWSSIFIGHQDTETPCHTDSFYVSVWLALITGEKTIRYVSSNFHEYMYSGIDLFSNGVVYDLNEKGIDVFQSNISSGDIAYHPPGWWHQVKNHSFNIAVSNNYVGLNNYLIFEQQLVAKTVLPILDKLVSLGHTINVESILNTQKTGVISKQCLQSSKYLNNQQNMCDFLQEYVFQYRKICDLLINEI